MTTLHPQRRGTPDATEERERDTRRDEDGDCVGEGAESGWRGIGGGVRGEEGEAVGAGEGHVRRRVAALPREISQRLTRW